MRILRYFNGDFLPDIRNNVVYITGTGCCGSTLLDVMLGQQPGLWTVGEIHLLERWLIEGRTCGCGALVSDCAFWTAVRNRLSDDVINIVGMLRHPPSKEARRFVGYIWVRCCCDGSLGAADRALLDWKAYGERYFSELISTR